VTQLKPELGSVLRYWQSLSAKCQSKALLRAALDPEASQYVILEMAAASFKNEGDLRGFIGDLGTAIRRGVTRPVFDDLDRSIVTLWDGFHRLKVKNRNDAAMVRNLPGLCREKNMAMRLAIDMLQFRCAPFATGAITKRVGSQRPTK